MSKFNKHNKFVNRTFFASLLFAVASPLYRKNPLHKKFRLQRRYKPFTPMYKLTELKKIILSELEAYSDEFKQTLADIVRLHINARKNSCLLFIDPASFLNGTWFIWVEGDDRNYPEFKEFYWYEILSIDQESQSEDYVLEAIEIAFDTGYEWLIMQLKAAQSELSNFEIQLFHNGSMDKQSLD